MPRTFPIFALMFMGGLIASLLGGFLLASWTVAGITPAYAISPTIAEAKSTLSQDPEADGWRKAGYDRIGLWEQPRADTLYADGSSRL